MRVFSLFIVLAFSFQSLDIPSLKKVSNPKTCCGRSVCQCTHAKGVSCDFRHRIPRAPLNQDLKSASVNKAALSKAPCHSDAPKTMMTRGYFQDFDLIPSNAFSLHFANQFLFYSSPNYPRGISLTSIEPPPKFLSI